MAKYIVEIPYVAYTSVYVTVEADSVESIDWDEVYFEAPRPDCIAEFEIDEEMLECALIKEVK